MKKQRGRKKYDIDEYQRLTCELEAILDNSTQLDLSGEGLNIYEEEKVPELKIYVAASEMQSFSKLEDFDCRTIKLINFNRPAIRISYFRKHKYFMDKKPLRRQVLALIDGEIQDLLRKLGKAEQACEDYGKNNMIVPDELVKNRQQIIEELEYLKKLAKDSGSYQFSISNYDRHYIYSYINYKYIENGRIETDNSHLIKHKLNPDDTIKKECKNVIFVDEVAIAQPVSYDNKKITDFLNSFSKKIHCGTFDLYVRD